jgi:5'-deoxynucleotidase YfbR-like HD superfamily hydrolase
VYEYLSYVTGRLSSIARYSTEKSITRQSVMEHIGNVAFITLVLSEYLNERGIRNDSDKAVKLALMHDVSEIISGDLPHDSKYGYGKISEGLRKQLGSLEEITMQYALGKLKDDGLSRMLYSLFEEYNKRKTIESKIVKIADLYDVVLYTHQEMSLGNRSMVGTHRFALRNLKSLLNEICNKQPHRHGRNER